MELSVEEKVVKKDLGRVLLNLEELQDEQIRKALEPKEVTPTMTEHEKKEALRLLRDPKLVERIVADIPLVGEGTNKLVVISPPSVASSTNRWPSLFNRHRRQARRR